jgi:hypothetical protein
MAPMMPIEAASGRLKPSSSARISVRKMPN